MKLVLPIFVMLVLLTSASGCTSDSDPVAEQKSRGDRSSQRTRVPTTRENPPVNPPSAGVDGVPPSGGNGSINTRWIPSPGSSWQLQLSGTVDTSVKAEIFDIDAFDVPASTVTELHRQGRHVICYFSAGTFEDWRPDAKAFPATVKGSSLDEWPGERWLDIRQLDILEPIMAARMDMCADKGFDAVDPDNVDGYTNRSGFPLTSQDQLRYNQMLARMAHKRGLSVGLKNDLDQVSQLVADFDFAVNEQCGQYSECSMLAPFVNAGKAVLHVEYELDLQRFCGSAAHPGFSSIRKHLDLGAWRETC